MFIHVSEKLKECKNEKKQKDLKDGYILSTAEIQVNIQVSMAYIIFGFPDLHVDHEQI